MQKHPCRYELQTCVSPCYNKDSGLAVAVQARVAQGQQCRALVPHAEADSDSGLAVAMQAGVTQGQQCGALLPHAEADGDGAGRGHPGAVL